MLDDAGGYKPGRGGGGGEGENDLPKRVVQRGHQMLVGFGRLALSLLRLARSQSAYTHCLCLVSPLL
jgi:hypothetical protein